MSQKVIEEGKQVFERLSSETQRYVDTQHELLTSKFSEYIPKVYERINNEIKDPRATYRAIVYRFRDCCNIATIRRYIPLDAKDAYMSHLADVRNEKKRQEDKQRKEHEIKEKERERKTNQIRIWLPPKSVYRTALRIIWDANEVACFILNKDHNLIDIKSKSEIEQEEIDERGEVGAASPAM